MGQNTESVFKRLTQKQESLVGKCHHHRSQTNLQHREEETQNTDSKNTITVKQPSLSTTAR